MPALPVATLAADMRRQHMRAWTGGSPPRKFLQCCALERALRSLLFREQSRVYVTYWEHPLPADVARIFYRRAAADAHSTMRPLTES